MSIPKKTPAWVNPSAALVRLWVSRLPEINKSRTSGEPTAVLAQAYGCSNTTVRKGMQLLVSLGHEVKEQVIPPDRYRKHAVLDWDACHGEIRKMMEEGASSGKIASHFGLKPGTLSSYLHHNFSESFRQQWREKVVRLRGESWEQRRKTSNQHSVRPRFRPIGFWDGFLPRINELRAAGLTAADIAADLSLPLREYRSGLERLRSAGRALVPASSTNTVSPEQQIDWPALHDQVVSLMQEGAVLGTMARRLGVTRDAVSNYIYRTFTEAERNRWAHNRAGKRIPVVQEEVSPVAPKRLERSSDPLPPGDIAWIAIWPPGKAPPYPDRETLRRL